MQNQSSKSTPPRSDMKCNLSQHINCGGRLHSPGSFKTSEGRKMERWETKEDDSKQMARESDDQTKRKSSM